MSLLVNALPTIFLHEGGFSNNPKDPGGATNYGISLRFLLATGDLDRDGLPDGDIDHDGDIDLQDIKNMKPENAAKLFDWYFWTRYGYGAITNQTIATKLLDLSVNMGSIGAHKCLQRSLRAANGIQLKEDGIIGKETLIATNNSSPVSVFCALKSEAAGYYRSIRYAGAQDFLSGWLNRAYSNVIST